MAGKRLIETIVIDSSSDEESCTPISRVKNRDEMKKLEIANEDCFILDFDPDDADLDLSKLSISDENADADLLVVSHKGQVACRDYPHPRHECAGFPFRTTPHESHCRFCYCYVCDLPAPCKSWVGDFNHCCAFDNERWTAIRKLVRQAIELQKQSKKKASLRVAHVKATQQKENNNPVLVQDPQQERVRPNSSVEAEQSETEEVTTYVHKTKNTSLIKPGFNRSNMSDSNVKKGTVKWFDDLRGFGFIIPDDGTGDVFVHQSSINCDGFRSLDDGETVEYKIEIGNDGRPKAIDVTGYGVSDQGYTRGSGSGVRYGGGGPGGRHCGGRGCGPGGRHCGGRGGGCY